jgi:DNA-binding transcriptional ArsR family regulator
VFERIARGGEATATGLVKRSQLSQPAVSQHLRSLPDAGLVTERRDGRQVRYYVEPRGLVPLIDWLGVCQSFRRERFDNLEKLLKDRGMSDSGATAAKQKPRATRGLAVVAGGGVRR